MKNAGISVTFMIGICQGETEIPRVLLAAEPVSLKQRCRHRSFANFGDRRGFRLVLTL